MVREFSKLMLRAYNNEADNAVRTMKPYTLDSSIARLVKARETITRLGGTMDIMVTDPYHRLRVEELDLTADYLAKVAEQKDREREERARLREEQIARHEYEREQERLRKEQAHYQTAVTALRGPWSTCAASSSAPAPPKSATSSPAWTPPSSNGSTNPKPSNGGKASKPGASTAPPSSQPQPRHRRESGTPRTPRVPPAPSKTRPNRGMSGRSRVRLLYMNILARWLHAGSTGSLPGWRHRETEYRQRTTKLDPSNSNFADASASRLCPISASRPDDHFISAERNAAHVRSLQRSHDDIRISSQCLIVVMA